MTLTISVRRAGLALMFLLVFGLALGLPGAATAAERAKVDTPERIVALTPFGANVLADLGVKPVAVGEGAGADDQYDRSLRNVPRLALSHASNGPNLEQLVQMDPDLVLSERTWAAGQGAIEDLGIQVELMDPYTLVRVAQRIRAIGRLVGRPDQAKRLAKRTKRSMQRAQRNIDQRPRVLMILGVGQTPYAFLPNSWGGNLVSAAGADLITEGLDVSGSQLLVSGGFAQLSDEEILIRNPDVIIAIPHGRADDLDAIAAQLRADETLAATNAGANGRVYVTDDAGLLQASEDPAKTISMVRRAFLLNR